MPKYLGQKKTFASEDQALDKLNPKMSELFKQYCAERIVKSPNKRMRFTEFLSDAYRSHEIFSMAHRAIAKAEHDQEKKKELNPTQKELQKKEMARILTVFQGSNAMAEADVCRARTEHPEELLKVFRGSKLKNKFEELFLPELEAAEEIAKAERSKKANEAEQTQDIGIQCTRHFDGGKGDGKGGGCINCMGRRVRPGDPGPFFLQAGGPSRF